MKILLVHPPTGFNVPIDQRTDCLSIAYVGAVLRRDGHEVEVFDAGLYNIDVKDTLKEILNRDFECLGITSTHEQKEFLISAARTVRSRKKDVLIVAGGYLPTLAPELLLKACPEIDILIRGEGEAVVSDVFGRITRGEDWQSTPGIAYLRDNSPVINPLPPLIQDLDTLPFPIRDALAQGPSQAQASVASSRGCYHQCSFCCINSFYALSGGRAPRFRSPENFVDELESIISSIGERSFMFIDDDFIGPGQKARERVIRIAELLRERKLNIKFNIECRADEVDEDILKLLKEVGLAGVFLGIESGVQRQLDTFNKKMTVEQNKRAIEVARNSGVDVKSGLILFDPYTTVEEIEQNKLFIQEMRINSVALESRVTLYHGVPLLEKVKEDGLLLDKGLELDYKFKDPSIGTMWKMTKASASLSDFMKKAKLRFMRRVD